MTRRTTWMAFAAAAALAGAGCGEDGEEEPTGSSTTAEPAAAASARLELTLTESGKKVRMEGPESVPGGVVEIVLNSEAKGEHGAQLVRVDGDRTAAEVDAAGDAWGDKGKALPSWMHLEGGVVAGSGGPATSVQVLAPGRYFAIDIQADQKPSPAVEFEVIEGDGGELPATEATVTMDEYSFAGAGLKPGAQKVLVENTGTQPHFIVGVPLAKGATLEDAKTFLESEGEGAEGPPPVDFEEAFSTSVMDGGGRQVVDLELTKGKYVFVCFIPDRAGGPPHVAKGMVSEVAVG